MAKKANRFDLWLEEEDTDRIAKLLKVDPSTVRKWRKGFCPRADQMKRIRDLTRGRVNYNDIVECVLQAKGARR